MIPAKFYRYVFTFIMSAFMAFIISFAMTYFHFGFVGSFVQIWIVEYLKAFMIAYPAIFVVAPLAAKLANLICKGEK
ncbi:DUF2798 domain-containing protein [Campylobacter concisus]|uniref:DUF2798 domain-containing protein n=1 Tax=Campylobacter concisus TaxID=199 RepID=A0A2R4P2T3_9BACT|nr:DUF2798 domain-containing protein [Campylobacter concisus]AVX44964.1 hypothetical protein CCS77_1903 [Campylobacter concisus]